MRATMVEVPAQLREHVVGRVDYADAVGVTVPTADCTDTIGWARTCFQGAPAPLRWLLSVGWMLLLLEGLPRCDDNTTLGWPIVRRDDPTVLRRRSRFGLTATLILTNTADSVIFASAVTFQTRVARAVWTVVQPIHRLAVRVLLSNAARVRS